MSDQKKWKAKKKDAIFAIIVIAVIVLLILGTGNRTTKVTPNNKVHTHAITRQACMQCHGKHGVHPRPVARHVKGDQCFQCHTQPRDWAGAKQ